MLDVIGGELIQLPGSAGKSESLESAPVAGRAAIVSAPAVNAKAMVLIDAPPFQVACRTDSAYRIRPEKNIQSTSNDNGRVGRRFHRRPTTKERPSLADESRG